VSGGEGDLGSNPRTSKPFRLPLRTCGITRYLGKKEGSWFEPSQRRARCEATRSAAQGKRQGRAVNPSLSARYQKPRLERGFSCLAERGIRVRTRIHSPVHSLPRTRDH